MYMIEGRSALQAWEFIPAFIVGGIYILDMYNTGEYFCKGTHWNCLDESTCIHTLFHFYWKEVGVL
jgi:hypothetical protein